MQKAPSPPTPAWPRSFVPFLDDVQGSFLTFSPLSIEHTPVKPGGRPKKHVGLKAEREKNNFGQLWQETIPQWELGKGTEGRAWAPLGEEPKGAQASVEGGKGLHSQVFSHPQQRFAGKVYPLSFEKNPRN